jgi:hypothetical protein
MKKSELKKIIKDVIRETFNEQAGDVYYRGGQNLEGLPIGYSSYGEYLSDTMNNFNPNSGGHPGDHGTPGPGGPRRGRSKAKPTKKRNLSKKKVGHLEQTDPVIPDVDPEVQGHEGPHPVSRIPKPNQGRPNISPKPKPRLNTGNTMAQQKRRKFLSKGLKK